MKKSHNSFNELMGEAMPYASIHDGMGMVWMMMRVIMIVMMMMLVITR